MTEEKQKVPFDPGYSDIAVEFPTEVNDFLDEIATLKQNHQKKFAFVNLENQIVPLVKNSAAFYAGCVVWGSYLFWKYKEDPREIEGNNVLSLSEEDKDKFAGNQPVDFILDFIDGFDKSAKYYLKRSSRIPRDCVKYFEVYKKFAELNNYFKNLKYTNEIKLPEETAHFENYDEQKLEKIKDKIYEVINSGKLETLLETGFYKNL